MGLPPVTLQDKRTLRIPAQSDLGLVELRAATPLVLQLLPSGALFAVRHGPTLLNQLLPDPAEDGLFRLLLRVRGAAGAVTAAAPLAGPGLAFSHAAGAARWETTVGSLQCTTILQVHPSLPAWRWLVRLRNPGPAAQHVDVLHAQDVGLADEGAVRNNEAYTSQYVDLLPQRDEALGWILSARQNQPASGGRHPWLAFACTPGAEAFCTDGWQFFGADHRLTGTPAALAAPALESRRLQYEAALGGLQSRVRTVAAGATAEITFVARFLEDHPTATSAADLAVVRDLAAARWEEPVFPAPVTTPRSLFLTAPWAHGDTPSAEDLAAWFPGSPRHVERTPDGVVQSFFCATDTHVVTRAKEATVARLHGHILRNGDSSWIDDHQFGLTCYAAGIFAAQVYLGNPSFGRLLPVVRNGLNLARAAGQRVFVRGLGSGWRQLGLASAFAMTPGEVRWLYRLGATVIEARAWCAPGQPASYCELRVLAGPACSFLVSHQLVLGTAEFEHVGTVTVHAEEGWFACRPSPGSLVGQHQPGTAFAIAAGNPGDVAALGGAELLQPDRAPRTGTQVVFETKPVTAFTVIMLGGYDGDAGLPAAVESARAGDATAARPIEVRLGLAGGAAAETARVAEIVPWFNHNASVHFSTPHGLEQYGGAAWGVRDVCQGSVEWLLTADRPDLVRRTLLAVFAQQYREDGGWPQWFMHDPYRFIQQAHSHGDVCFWPVKALCDYVEASNDFGFLSERIGYTDPERFGPAGPAETLWEHCDRVVAQCEARFMPGTALVNYGDGDWDDTLQPADPAMRTGMTSAWTVGLAFHAFRQLADVARRAGETARADHLEGLLRRMRQDFVARLMPDGIVAGFLLTGKDGALRPLLHPADKVTGIRYRLLPMTRSIIAELFTPDEARRHLEIIERELRYPDGVRLMSEPAVYHGGLERLFKRADTAANVGREIGLQYVHAHLRYAEALAKVGDGERLWQALQVVNPVGLAEVVPNAAPRQSNVYFSSSDADFADRYEAARRWPELRTGRVAVRGGWRLYSSGPGLYLHKLRSCLLGVRESFGRVIFDPVLPRSLDGLRAELQVAGRAATVTYRFRATAGGPVAVSVNGTRLDGLAEVPNPYRRGGVAVPRERLASLLRATANGIDVEM